MPVFGKGRTTRLRYAYNQKRLNWAIERVRTKRKYYPFGKWKISQTSLDAVSQKLLFPIKKWIKSRFRQVNAGQKNQGLVIVLDWGCGPGIAITQLAKQMPKMTICYGYSKESFPEWEENAHVKFIHETAEALLRYLKPHSVDLVFSHYGLHHLEPIIGTQRYAQYLKRFSTRLKPGGIIITTLGNVSSQSVWEELISRREDGLNVHVKSCVLTLQKL